MWIVGESELAGWLIDTWNSILRTSHGPAAASIKFNLVFSKKELTHTHMGHDSCISGHYHIDTITTRTQK